MVKYDEDGHEKLSAAERLSDLLHTSEREAAKLREELEAIKHQDEWRWRNIRKLSEEENLGLPVPRLEIRYRQQDDYNMIADYGLVNRHLMGHLDFIPFGSTRIGGTGARSEERALDLPFRDGAHIQNDMWELNLPGYVVNGKKSKKIEQTRDDMPNALLRKVDAKQKPGAIP